MPLLMIHYAFIVAVNLTLKRLPVIILYVRECEGHGKVAKAKITRAFVPRQATE